jgi:hypothetical protein
MPSPARRVDDESPEPQELVVRTAPKDFETISRARSVLVAEVERELPDEIVSPAEYTAVADLERRLGAYVEKYEPLFAESTDFAHKAWKAACRIYDVFIDGPKGLQKQCKRLRGVYEKKEEDGRRERERQIAEEETRKERERLAREAKLLERQGQKDMAAAVRATPVVAPAISLPRAVPQVSGVASTRSNWTWRIAGCTDIFGGRKNKDARKRAASLAPRQFLDLDDAAITAHVKNNRSATRIPGIEVYEEKV